MSILDHEIPSKDSNEHLVLLSNETITTCPAIRSVIAVLYIEECDVISTALVEVRLVSSHSHGSTYLPSTVFMTEHIY